MDCLKGLNLFQANFVTLLKEFRTEFDKYGYLLTAAVAATGSTVDTAYDVPGLSKYVIFEVYSETNIMGFLSC